jgi:hypothetical protein
MAQTGYTPLLIYSSSTAAAAPIASNLTNSTLGSELAINITDGKLFYKDNANVIQVIGWKTVPTTAGGTGLTSYTAGDMVYYASGTAFTKLAIGASGRWLGSSGTDPQWNAPAALTKTDDTNVTLTLGGNASTALLNAASLTLGWTGTLATNRGGTGLSSFTANGVLYASSTSALATGSAFTFSSPTVKLATTSANFYAEVPDGSGGGQALMKAGDAAGRYFAMRGTSYDFDPAFLSSGATNVTMKNLAAQATSMTWGSTGDITINAGNLIQGTAAKGINFTANANAPGMTSELLNWYEEGTWTARISDGTNNATQNRSTCRYTRIGRQVTVAGFISVTSLGSVTGDIRITGLPFTVGSSDESYSAGAVSYAGNLSITAGQSVTVTAWAGNTYLNLQLWDSANGTTAMQASEFTASGAIMFSCTYTV